MKSLTPKYELCIKVSGANYQTFPTQVNLMRLTQNCILAAMYLFIRIFLYGVIVG